MATADTIFSPAVAWEFHTALTLSGLALAREAQTLLAWDAAHVLYLLDGDGSLLARWPSSFPVQAAAISDDGQWIAAVADDGRVFWFDAAGGAASFVRGPVNPLAVAIDPQGWYVATSSARGDNLVLDRTGRMVSGFHSQRPFRFLTFLQERPLLLGVAEQGFVAGMTIYGRSLWKTLVGGNLAGLTADSRGALIVVPAHQHGLMRFSVEGKARGTYPFSEFPTAASLSAAGDLLLVGTMSQQAALLRKGQTVLWKQEVESKIVQVQLDALGRYGYVGLESGRIARIDFQQEKEVENRGPGAKDEKRRVAGDRLPAARKEKDAGKTIRRAEDGQAAVGEPAWEIGLPFMSDQLVTVALKIVDQPARVTMLLPNQSIAIYDGDSKKPTSDPLHVTPPLDGKGRSMLAGNGMLVGLTDRKCVVYDAQRNQSVVHPVRFTEITHSRIYNETELVLVQERDRLTRATLSGKVAWVEPLRDCVQELAVAAKTIAVVTDRGELIFYTPSGKVLQRIAPKAGALQLLAGLDEQFVTAGKDDRMVRAYSPFGELLWERLSPLEPWQLAGVGRRAVLRGLAGETIAISRSGKMTPGQQPVIVDETYFQLANGRLARIFRHQGKLCRADFSGKLLWRHILRGELGPLAVTSTGVAAIIDSRLCWFPSAEREGSGKRDREAGAATKASRETHDDDGRPGAS